MANQKSQIYPIQLQGAELNLNKFDTEIKQYSGFNKNNSPFVGGCLSNIFTKEETVSGATSENTYIDTNGDVYKLTADGLFKNNSKVLNSAKTINRTEVARDETLVKVFTKNGIDNFCLYYRNGIFYLNNYQLSVGLDSYLPEERVYYCCDGFFDTLNNTDCFIFTCIGITGLRLYIFDNISHSILSNTLLLDSKSPKTSSYILPTTFFHNTGSSNILLFCETRRPQPYYEHWLYYFQLKINSDFSVTFRRNRFELDDLQNSLKLRYGASTPTSIASPYFYDYILQSCPTNRIVARHTRDCTALYLKYQFFIDSDVNSYDNTDGSSLVIWDVDPSVRIESSYIRSSDLNNKYLDEAYKEEWLCLKQIASVLFQVIDINDVTYTAGINCSNVISLVSKSVEDQVRVRARSVMGHMCTLGDDNPFVLLINNGSISGIGTRNGILITAWNEIDSNSIFYTGSTITYKEGDTFYFIAETLSSGNLYRLKKVNNQIITNFDSENNSYDIVSQSAKLYAPSYNAALTTEKISFTQSDSNNYLCAAAVNEYALEKNCSILLNPQLCFLNDSAKEKLTPPSYVTDGVGFAYAINIYLGKDECLYYITVKQTNSFLNKNLYNLPFPSDTNGNVQYSPSLFSEVKDIYGNMLFIKSSNSFYPFMLYNNKPVMSFYLASGIDEVSEGFVVQGQFYVIINNDLYSASYANGVTTDVTFIVSVQGLKFCGNTPYQAFFFSKTNRCLYVFNGANVLQQSQFIDIYADIKFYKYNPATHSIFMVTDDCVLVFSGFGTFRLDVPNVEEIYLLENGIVLLNNVGTFMRIKYYNTEDGYTKQNVILETCFYGMNNEVVTVNDCLYFRIFSEEHEQGDLEVSATTLSLEGRKTEKTTFKIKESDWDKMTHTIYLRYQPKEQRGLGISFSINSPFKIASLSVGSQPDAVLIDKVSKGAINAPQQTSNNDEW